MKDIIRKLHVEYLRLLGNRKPEFRLRGEVVIVAPHPDDEVIGCGGLIARLVAEGNTPHIIVMTGGEGSHRGCCDADADEIKRSRRKLTDDALQILSVNREYIHELDFPDGGICEECSIEIGRLETLISDLKPEVVLVPHWGEGWTDHLNTANIVKKLTPPSAEIWEYCVWMWYYNVWKGLDWKNAFRLTLSPDEHKKKLEAMNAYIKPLASCGKPWSGNLPELLIKAHQSNKELYFKAR